MRLLNNNSNSFSINNIKIIKIWHTEQCQDIRMGNNFSQYNSNFGYRKLLCHGILKLIPSSHLIRPPITSGSMTLQHPAKQAKHQEAMLAAQGPPIHPQQMRQQNMGLGTQTLGRPHHSPNHMRNNSGKFSVYLKNSFIYKI